MITLRQVDSTSFYFIFHPYNHFSQSSWKTTVILFPIIVLFFFPLPRGIGPKVKQERGEERHGMSKIWVKVNIHQ